MKMVFKKNILSKKKTGSKESLTGAGQTKEGAVQTGQASRRIEDKVFIKFPDRVEPSGKKRIFISENGKDPFFEIFIWEEENSRTRFDFHYNVHDKEQLLTWRGCSEFSHMSVSTENEYNFRTKKTQTVAGQAPFEWKEIRKLFVERLNATYKNKDSYSVGDYCAITESIEFVLKQIDSRFSV